MKICLLANPRTGSTSLFGLIKSHLPKDYYCISEPFNSTYMSYTSDDRDHLSEFENSDNVFFKHICYQFPKKYETKEMWYEWLFANFDKIIFLDRKDRLLQSESFVYHETKNRGSWHVRSYYDLSDIDKTKIEERIELLNLDGEFMMSKSKDYPLFYYEDLFVDKNNIKINELLQYLNVSPIQKHIDDFIFSESKKVRMFNDNRTLM